MIHTQTDPASQACWDGEHEGYRTWKASQSFKKKKKKNQSFIYMMNQNPLLGFIANPQVPWTCNFSPRLAPSLILRKGFSDYISTIVLGFPELRKQWEYQTKDGPIE